MKICFHSHCFPDALAPRAMEQLKKNASRFGISPRTDGTSSGTEKILRAAGIGASLICNIATNARQEHNVNRFAISLAEKHGFMFATGSLHPDSAAMEDELSLLQKAGIRGIKIHPDYVGIDITDDRFDKIFSLAEERGMFVVTHSGADPVSPDRIHADAEGLYKVIKRHPKLILIAAHMGGPQQLDGVLELLAGTRIMFDTSLSSTRTDEREKLYKLLREHDPSRILFGTDTPWSDPEKEVEFVEKSGLDDGDVEKIFYRNAAKLLKID